MRNRDTINAETARATRLPGRTWPLRAASMGLRLADVTEMPTLRECRHLPPCPAVKARRGNAGSAPNAASTSSSQQPVRGQQPHREQDRRSGITTVRFGQSIAMNDTNDSAAWCPICGEAAEVVQVSIEDGWSEAATHLVTIRACTNRFCEDTTPPCARKCARQRRTSSPRGPGHCPPSVAGPATSVCTEPRPQPPRAR